MKINGSLVFDASSSSEIQNLRVQKVSTNPTWTSADAGRLIYNTTDGKLYQGGSSGWVALATGGNAAALQAEVDAIETSLGSLVTSSGVFVPGQVTVNGVLSNAANLTALLNEITAAISGKDALSELTDVSLGTPTAGDFLRHNGTKWTNATISLATDLSITATAAELNQLHGATVTAADLNKLHAVTADAAELNLLDGATLSTTQLNYVEGVTSPIQTQLDGKQAADATLTALAALSGTGILVETGVDTFAHRSLSAPAAGVTISNADGVGGNPTFALANDLAAVEGLADFGFAVRTAADTWVTRAIATASADRVTVTNGDGVAASPTVDLATVTDSGTGAFLKLAKDSYGRVTGTTPVGTSDITGLVDSQYLRLDGTTVMTGDLNAGGKKVTSVATPVAGNDAATKAYVDAISTGLSWKQAVRVATTGNITLSGEQTIDGVAVVAGDRVLVKNQTTAADNGIYVVAAGAWARAEDMNVAAEFDGAAVFVQEGTLNEGTGWTEQATVTTVGTSPVTFSQFSGGQAFIWGVGLASSGNTVNVVLGSGIAENPSDAVGLDLYDVANSALILTTDGSTRESPTSNDGQLFLLLEAAGGLAQTAAGLKIKAGGVSNAMLANSTITLDADDVGTASVALGGTLMIAGDSASGVSTSIVSGGYKVVVADAAYAQKGVASFDTNDFTVTAGAVSIKTGGVDNAQLANSSITLAGDAGSDAVALGETLTVKGAADGIVSTSAAANAVEVTVRDATVSKKGVASFSADHFSVTAGAVSLNASLDDLSNVAGADLATGGEVLRHDGSSWTAVETADLAADIKIDDLGDVTLTSTGAGQVLVHNGGLGGGEWVNKKIYHLHNQAAAAISWNVTHNIGQQYCNVTVVDSTDEVVIPQSITFDSANALTVTFNTAIAGKVVVMGMPSNFSPS